MRAMLVACVASCALLAASCRKAESVPVEPAAALPSAGPRPSAAPSAQAEEPDAAPALEVVGQTLAVKARHASGAPLHAEQGASSVSARLLDGSRVRVEAVSSDGRWYQVSQGATRGWLTRRYLVTETSGPKLSPQSVFASRAACLAALERGEKVPRQPGRARLGSWNLHWFPDGKPGKGTLEPQREAGTDLEWLACVISWLDVDVLAAQEIKGGPAAQAALERLRAHLAARGRTFAVSLDGCTKNGQHVGLLHDEKRVTRLAVADVAELNPHGSPCQDQLRPGHASFLRFRGGLDLHVVSAHFKAGGERRSLELRQRSFAALSETQARVQALGADSDVLLLGDLNTMGCPDCSPSVSHAEELAGIGTGLGAEGFRRIDSDRACSHHFDGQGTLLDGAVAALGFAELGEHPLVHVSGLCAELGCSPPRTRVEARERLSDHCPVYLDLEDRDRD
jgi:hypothetical protein